MEEGIKCEDQPKAENCNENKDGNNVDNDTKQNNLNNSSQNKKKKNKKAKKTNLKRINKNKNKKNKKNQSNKNVEKNNRNGEGGQINSIVDFLKKNEPERVQKEDIKELKKEEEKSSVEIRQHKNDKKKEKKKEKKNDSIDIEERNERTVFVGNIPLNDVGNFKLLKILGIKKSLVESIRFRSLPLEEKYAKNKRLGIMLKKFTDVKDNKNACIRLKRKEDVSLLLNKNGTVYNGYVLRVNKFGDQSSFSRKKTVCVKNLDRSINEKDLYELFKDVDEIKGVRILRDLENSQSRGVAFVLFENRASVKKAINLFNGKEIK
ncbi:hypothetical protein YYE_04995, partial [Plasmodium vinckei vinckei]